MDVRCLHRPVNPQDQLRASSPHAAPQTREERHEIVGHLQSTLLPPLHGSRAEFCRRIEAALDTMTLPERVLIELDMDAQRGRAHASDYDPWG